MEDLRDNKKKLVEEGKKTTTKQGLWLKISIIIYKFFKLWHGFTIIKVIAVSAIITLILMYPNEFGTFIGNWTHLFLEGLYRNFK